MGSIFSSATLPSSLLQFLCPALQRPLFIGQSRQDLRLASLTGVPVRCTLGWLLQVLCAPSRAIGRLGVVSRYKTPSCNVTNTGS